MSKRSDREQRREERGVEPAFEHRDNDTGTVRRRVTTPVGGESLTEQHHKPHVDINNIMARYVKTGTLDHVRTYEGQYGDLPPDDYHESQSKVAEAKSMFEDLPSQLRRFFDNDTAKFLQFCVTRSDPAGELSQIAERMRKEALGLDRPEESDQRRAEPADNPTSSVSDPAPDDRSGGS